MNYTLIPTKVLEDFVETHIMQDRQDFAIEQLQSQGIELSEVKQDVFKKDLENETSFDWDDIDEMIQIFKQNNIKLFKTIKK